MMNIDGVSRVLRGGLCLVLVMGAVSCASGGAGRGSAEPEVEHLTGAVDRETVENAFPEWVRVQVETEIDSASAVALSQQGAGGELVVYFGTWCGDSKREVSRFWRVLDEVGSMVPFDVRYVAVGEDKNEPADLLEGVDLLYVPTFVVRRGGEEVGRIVETPVESVEADLLGLFRGEHSGILTSSRPELLGDSDDEGNS